MRRRDAFVAAAIAIGTAALIATPLFERLHAFSLDVLFWLRAEIYGPLHRPQDSPTVVVAIDEESHRRPPFAGVPTALWTRDIVPVLDAIVAGGARVVGFDVIFPNSAEQIFARMTERVGSGWEREFLVSLRNAAKPGKLVLGKVQHSQSPIRPHQAQSFAVGNQQNIRSNNLLSDVDGRIRRIPLFFESLEANGGTRTETSMSLELAARARGVRPQKLPDGGISLAGWRIPGSESNSLLANFDVGNDIPTFSLADLYACAQKGDAAFFRRHFEGKVVLLGAVLDLEDRKLTSKRFITAPDSSAYARCVHPPMPLARADVVRETVPGVYIHATAVNNLLRGDALATFRPSLVFAAILVLCGGAAVAGMALSPLPAALALGALGAVWTAACVVLLRHAVAAPLFPPLLGGAVVLALVLAFRFVVADRDKRFLRKSFSLYLSPAMVEEMLRAEKPPELGGETRTVTILFSDVAGFTSLSETLPPGELVRLMNAYLSAMTEIVQKHKGYVDNFIGDAIIAVFGAPLSDPDHARHAVACAIECRRRLAELNRDTAAFAGRRLEARIGLNTGEVLVGNIGSKDRLKYTVMGDAVNLASRLEGANKVYRTAILVSEDTVAAAGPGFEFREIDRVRVKGRAKAVAIYEPLGDDHHLSPAGARDFAAALAAYREGRFEEAARRFERLAPLDPTAEIFAGKALALAAAPPADWQPVTALETK
jgi:class 3 adenylate cyclase/CHASE2 domain-containing sensor protein